MKAIKIVWIICLLLISLLLVRFLNIIACVIFLIIGSGLFVFNYYKPVSLYNPDYNPKNIIHTPPKYPINYALLLCMHNNKSKQDMYIDVIKYYTDVLKFPKNNIFIVDSSGNGVDDKYIYIKNQVVFNQKEYKSVIKTFQCKGSPSKYEILCLLIASKQINFKKFTYVIKLTCKYKIPELYTIENNMNSVLLLQNKTHKDEQNSEIFGVKTEYFINIIDKISKTEGGSMEHILYTLSKVFSSQHLPFLSNIATYKRSLGDFLQILSYGNFITFIIPSIGRKTLLRTIKSLENQTVGNWKAIIVFDGVKSTISVTDKRISIIEIKKTGVNVNNAGNVRNVALKQVDTKWAGFVDDDDTLSEDYVECLLKNTNLFEDVNTFIFRMCYKDGRILPSFKDDNFGISFAVKTKFYKNNNLYFTEDFYYLDKIRKLNERIVILENIGYYVNCNPFKIDKKFNNVFINYPIYETPNLYCFWTGNNKMSETRKKCFDSLKNTKFNVILVTQDNIDTYILPDHPLHSGYVYLSETHKSDYLRTYFMNFYGGGYCDIKLCINSWIPSYEKLLYGNAIAIGYEEVENGNVYLENIVPSNNFIGNGSYICKPHTDFTKEWYNEMINCMDEKYEKLQQYPSRKPDEQREVDDYQYHLRWTELLGEIFHKYNYKYRHKILRGLPVDFMNEKYR